MNQKTYDISTENGSKNQIQREASDEVAKF